MTSLSTVTPVAGAVEPAGVDSFFLNKFFIYLAADKGLKSSTVNKVLNSVACLETRRLTPTNWNLVGKMLKKVGRGLAPATAAVPGILAGMAFHSVEPFHIGIL